MLIEQLLDRHRLRLLGVAHTAFAFERPGLPFEAIKVGFDVDDGWPAWAAWARTAGSPHVPVVHDLQWFGDRDRAPVLFVARVERLFPALEPRRWIKAYPALKRDPLGLAAFVEAEHPSIAAMLRAAAAAFPRGHFDMGGPNWLERSDGNLVLNDPLSRADTAVAAAA